jgi:hypothetical protein
MGAEVAASVGSDCISDTEPDAAYRRVHHGEGAGQARRLERKEHRGRGETATEHAPRASRPAGLRERSGRKREPKSCNHDCRSRIDRDRIAVAMAAPVRMPAAVAAKRARSDHIVAANSSTARAIWTL